VELNRASKAPGPRVRDGLDEQERRQASLVLGDEVEVMIPEIDEGSAVSAWHEAVQSFNPWQEFAQDKKRGDRVKGPIKSITDFGVSVGWQLALMLVHLSDLSWNEPGETAVRNYKSTEVTIILAVDVDRERISLYQAARFRPFHHVRVDQRQGAIVTGKVKTVDAKGAEIDS
jgi:small subunit ribosomal protein S1